MALDIKFRNIQNGGFLNNAGYATYKKEDGKFYCGRDLNGEIKKCDIELKN
jgi:hypothetical protein